MYVYSHKINNRIRYIFNYILKDLLLIKEVEFTSDVEFFSKKTEPKINYSSLHFENSIQILPCHFLFETGLKEQNLSISYWKELPIFFLTKRNLEIPFDIAAASFYLITRYEEYLPSMLDAHNRFYANQSFAYKNNFLKLPIVELWVAELKKIIENSYPKYEIPKKQYKYVSTIDVDNAWAFKNKGFARIAGAMFKNIYQLNFDELSQRIRVFLNSEEDPFYTYNYLKEQHTLHNTETIFFILFANYGHNDKNVPTNNSTFQYLIKSLNDNHTVGIHPGYNSNYNYEKLEKEIHNLSKVLNKEIQHSRQHFLKLAFPKTYQDLLSLDIQNDYTMGFADENGFRAGTSTAFNFYNLDTEQETKLKIHPFQVMDATLHLYKKLSTEQAIAEIKELVDVTRKVNGTFISLWHNETVSENKIWKNWSTVFEQLLAYASEKQ
jgi:hypothetical protein